MFRILTGTICPCDDGYYDNGSSPTCQSCHYSCATCTLGNLSSQCTSCKDSSISHRVLLNAAVCNCQDGYFNLEGL